MSLANTSLARLRWRCRRGTRELDVLLGGWLDACYGTSDVATRDAFADFLDVQDPELWDWLVGNATPTDPRFTMIIDEIRSRHRF